MVDMGTVQGTGYSLPDGLGPVPALGTCELRGLELVASLLVFYQTRRIVVKCDASCWQTEIRAWCRNEWPGLL